MKNKWSSCANVIPVHQWTTCCSPSMASNIFRCHSNPFGKTFTWVRNNYGPKTALRDTTGKSNLMEKKRKTFKRNTSSTLFSLIYQIHTSKSFANAHSNSRCTIYHVPKSYSNLSNIIPVQSKIIVSLS